MRQIIDNQCVLLFLLNRLNYFDGKIPFDFKSCCNINDNKNLGKCAVPGIKCENF